MPNDTDMSVFRDRGKRGLNFAIAGASGFYHSEADTAQAIDRGSLDHMGDTAVRMARQLGGIDLGTLDRSRRAFVGAPPFGLLVWGHRAHVWIALALLVAVAVGISKRSETEIGGVVRGFIGALLLLISCGGASNALGHVSLTLLDPVRPASNSAVLFLLLILVVGALAGTLLWHRLWTRGPAGPQRGREALIGALIIWTGLTLFFFRIDLANLGASYAFAAGSICLSIAVALRLFRRPPSWVVALVVLPAVYLLGPLLGQLVQLSSQALPSAVAVGSSLLALGSLLVVPVAVGASPVTDN